MTHPENIAPTQAPKVKIGLAFKNPFGKLVEVERDGQYLTWQTDDALNAIPCRNVMIQKLVKHEIGNAYIVMLHDFAFITIGEQ